MTLIQALFYFSILIIVLLSVLSCLLVKNTRKKNNTLLEINKLLNSNADYIKDRVALPASIKEGAGENSVIADAKNLLAAFRKAVEEESGLLDVILNSIDRGALIIDGNKEIYRINENLLNSFYLKEESVLGKSTAFIFKNEKFEKLTGKAFNYLKKCSDKITFYGDEDRYFLVEAIPVNSGIKKDIMKNIKLLVIFENTTQEVEFSRLRSQFVANVSHEMRTPLTSIRGYIDTILEDSSISKKKIKDYLERSLGEVERLNFLIKDVLNLSNIEFKRNVLFEKNYNLVSLIEETIKSLEFLAEKNGIEIKFKHSSDVVYYKTDEELFTQMIRNIIENSIFYCGSGAEVKVDLEENDSDVILKFRDNAGGIDKDELPYIFQRFYRGKSSKSSKQIGSGLGLAIVKHTVELHRGNIKVNSIPGKETLFEIRMPKK
jgi:two-component system, OmpR family, phosphate regulon sensor histidine kinase PhoR